MDNFLLSMEHWLVGLRSNFADIRPDLLYLFDTYAEEAIFGRCYIAHTLSHLGPDARILEVGAGSLLLSCQLAREGFHVTALEPTGEGFSHFEQMRQLPLCRVVADDCLPRVLDIAAEALAERSEEHTSELQSLMRISYAVFCLKKKKTNNKIMK